MKNIYELAKQRMNSEDIDNHMGDLYLKVTPISTKLVEDYDYKNHVTTFVSQIDCKLWYDIPFAYLNQYIKDEAEERKKFAEWIINRKTSPQ